MGFILVFLWLKKATKNAFCQENDRQKGYKCQAVYFVKGDNLFYV